jgi:hypothetical protein
MEFSFSFAEILSDENKKAVGTKKYTTALTLKLQ